MIIKAQEGKVFKRIHDGYIMGEKIHLGFDFSTGVKRQDKEEYYTEIDKPEEYYTEIDKPEEYYTEIDKPEEE